MYDYAQRQEIIYEVHSRPFQNLPAPLVLEHITVLFDGMDALDVEHLVMSFIREMSFPVPEGHRGFLYCRQGDKAVRYEPHNEFYTLTLYKFEDERTSLSLPEYRRQLPGAFLSGVEVLFRKSKSQLFMGKRNDSFTAWGEECFNSSQFVASEVMAGAARMATNYKPQPESGFVLVLLEDIHLMPAQAGRMLQRICEIETYRHMALLGLPSARSLMPELTLLDQEVASVSQRSPDQDTSHTLAAMMQLSGQVEALSANTANRFFASEAYFALVERRIKELREIKIKGRQMAIEFMERHLDPARRTCRSASRRIELLSKRIARATELLQFQVNLTIENQNKELLEAMNIRAKRRLNLQSKLESLSVLVVVYYLYDLIGKALGNMLPAGETLDQSLKVLTLSLPFMTLIMFWIIRHLMKDFTEH